MRESGPWERVHPVGYVDAMAAAEMRLATGVTEGLAGRKAALGAALGERFPAMRDLVLSGDLPVSSGAQGRRGLRRVWMWRRACGWMPTWRRGWRRWTRPG